MACPQMQTKDGFEYQLGVCHLGHFLLTSMLLPLLRWVGGGGGVWVCVCVHGGAGSPAS